MRLHKRYERDSKLVAEKRSVTAAKVDLACSVYSFDFQAAYSDSGENISKSTMGSRSIHY